MDYSWELTDQEREALLTLRRLEKIEPGSVEGPCGVCKVPDRPPPREPDRKNVSAPMKAGSIFNIGARVSMSVSKDGEDVVSVTLTGGPNGQNPGKCLGSGVVRDHEFVKL